MRSRAPLHNNDDRDPVTWDSDLDQSTPESAALSTHNIYAKKSGEELDDDADADAVVDRGMMNLADTVGWICCTILLFILFNTLLLMGKVDWLPMPEHLFAIYIGVFLATFTVVTVFAGVAHTYCHANIAYTRKVAHFFSFFLPFGLYVLIPFTKTLTTYVLTACCLFISFVPLTKPIRSLQYMWIARMAFASFDRKEDRPYTLLWAITQALAVYVVMLCVVLVLYQLKAEDFAIIPLLITGFGDGLAEVVGRPFGRHKYRTSALGTSKLYERSVEGSMMIVLTSVVVVSVLFGVGSFSLLQFAVSLVLFPIPMAITEAISMHSWDNAFLCLVGGIISIGVAFLGHY